MRERNVFSCTLPELPPGMHTLLINVTRLSRGGSFSFIHRLPLEITAEGVEFVVGCYGDPPGTARLIRNEKRLEPLAPVIWEAEGTVRFLPIRGETYIISEGKIPQYVYLYRGGRIPVKIKMKTVESAETARIEWSQVDEKSSRVMLVARKVTFEPKIEEFSNLVMRDVFTQEFSHSVQGERDGEKDLLGKICFGYDDENLYVWGEIVDDKIRVGGTWDSDRINFVFNALNNTTEWDYSEGPTGFNKWNKDDFWVFANLLMEKPEVTRMGGETPSGGLGFWGQVKDATAQTEITNEKYRFILRMPFKSLPHLNNSPHSVAGFVTFYTDWDDAISEMMFFMKWPASGGSIVWKYWDMGILYFAE